MKVTGKSGRYYVSKVGLFCLIVTVSTLLAIASFWTYQEVKTAHKQQATNEIIRIANARLAEIEIKKNEPVYITLPGADKLRAPAENYEEPNNVWTLVNKDRALPADYVPPVLIVASVSTRSNLTANGKQVSKTIDAPLTELFIAAQTDGHSLMIGSAYRSATTQDKLFHTYVSKVGYAEADKYSAHPGHSEHQTGLAVDISTASQQCYLSECFIDTADGQWLAENAYKYGFHLRYPKGKEVITGYNFEPWHYRYVGIKLATALYQSGLTLDEAWPYMETALATLRSNRAVR